MSKKQPEKHISKTCINVYCLYNLEVKMVVMIMKVQKKRSPKTPNTFLYSIAEIILQLYQQQQEQQQYLLEPQLEQLYQL